MQEISTSRAAIENRLIQELQAILQTEGITLDSRESAFNTYMIRALAQELASQLLYGTVISRESSLITAALPETVKNWAKYISYQYRVATPASTSLLITMPLMGEFVGRFDKGFEFKASNVIFTSEYLVTFSFMDSTFQIQFLDENNLVKAMPYYTTYNNSVPYANFLLPVKQVTTETFEFTIDDILPQEFYQKDITLSPGSQLAYVEVFDSDGNQYLVVDNIFSANSNQYVVLVDSYKEKISLVFGNGIFGKVPNSQITVNAYVTLGSAGNVLAGTINKGDTLYTQTSPPQVITYSVINTEDVTNGLDEESIDDIKKSAPIALTALNRIVSKSDFENASIILQNQDIMQSKPVLKRSDLVTNEVCLYSVFKMDNTIVPTDSVAVDISTDQTYISQDTVISIDGTNYIILFNIQLDHDLRIGRYSYTPYNIDVDLNLRYSTTSVTPTTTITVQYDPTSSNYKVYCSIITSEDLDDYNQQLQLFSNTQVFKYDPLSSAIIDSIKTFTYEVPVNTLLDAKRLEVYNLVSSSTVQIYDATIEIETDLSPFTFSYISKDVSKLFDVPVVLNSYYESLSENDKIYLREKIISDFLFKSNSYDKRLINSNISSKFARTCGKTKNTQFTTPSYIVNKIVSKRSDITESNVFYAVTDPVQDEELYSYAGSLVVYSTQLSKIETPIGTVIKNLDDGKVYSTDGRRWLLPIYDLPLYIEVEVHTKRTDSQLVTDVKNAILALINTYKIEESFYLSKLIQAVQKVNNIDYCRVISPRTDIIYRNIMDNITKEELEYYTPEYLYTDSAHIQVKVVHN